MHKILKALKQENIGAGYLYFVIHFIVEVVCFCGLYRVYGNSWIVWLVPLVYDFVAFVPQILIGHLADKMPKINFAVIGAVLLAVGFLLYSITLGGSLVLVGLVIFGLGNACVHVEGAEVTLRASNGNLSHSAIFVAGGSFGVITGKILAETALPAWVFAILALLIIPLALCAKKYKAKYAKCECKKFKYHKESMKPALVIAAVVFVVIARSYMAYSIPTSWNKSINEAILLFAMMGIGKALGGILSDAFGMRKVAAFSILGAIPFLIFGDQIMVVSIIGIMLFSMTMAITLGTLVSVLPSKPGVAFGFTTVGLFLGSLPIFFVSSLPIAINISIIVVASLISFAIIMAVTRKT